jgi:hypothetical protein
LQNAFRFYIIEPMKKKHPVDPALSEMRSRIGRAGGLATRRKGSAFFAKIGTMRKTFNGGRPKKKTHAKVGKKD